MKTDNAIEPLHTPKALSDLFTETELGVNLFGKKFVAVTKVTNPEASVLAKNGTIDTVTIDTDYGTKGYQLEKTITRIEIENDGYNSNSNSYSIYSAKLKTGTSGTFYTNSVVYYFIVTETTDFIETKGNYYIAQNIKLEKVETLDQQGVLTQTTYYVLDSNGNRLTSDNNPTPLKIDVDNYLKIWNSGSWATVNNTSLTDIDLKTTIATLNNTTYDIEIPSENLANLLGKNDSNSYAFDITVSYNNVVLDYEVRLNISLVKTTQEIVNV